MVVAHPGMWVEEWLSHPRFARYLRECEGDRHRALDTYEWNIQLGHAILREAGHFEIALRNAYDRAVSSRWNGPTHWLLDADSPLQRPLWRMVRGKKLDANTLNRKSIADAVRKRGGTTATPDAVVAELTFGFWEHLADTAHEQTMWIPYLYYAWPKGTSRRQIDRATHSISTLRNRAAHHEPLFDATGSHTVSSVHETLIRLLSMLNPHLAMYVQQTSTVAAVLAERP